MINDHQPPKATGSLRERDPELHDQQNAAFRAYRDRCHSEAHCPPRASELVARLQELIEEHGDLPVEQAGYYSDDLFVLGFASPLNDAKTFCVVPPQIP